MRPRTQQMFVAFFDEWTESRAPMPNQKALGTACLVAMARPVNGTALSPPRQ